ncbi:mediator complex subunit MED14-domain-containing protein [Dichotomopilus funicola]|uniref:Mediator of RNA polymerase II transcription subunit 14 n=1 Tax=Dichotomopilus funicola TaxID=1934379 RepID=A0AAN6ZRN2_9PEZI|nr:mediator complex subunit MED14-domain-containing protein [Dichotomopilus funicola]
MDSGMRTSTQPDHAKAPIVNGVKEESVPVKREYSGSSSTDDHGGKISGDYSYVENNLRTAKMEEAADEVEHITTDLIPLSLLLSRLAQYSHMKLQEFILEAASKPLPDHALNGNAKGAIGGINGHMNTNANGGIKAPSPFHEDTSAESLEKKTMALKFMQDLHSRWVKALVITEWSRNAEEVGRLIDLRTHLAQKLERLGHTFWEMVQVKTSMDFAKIPSPDLKTALEVLSTGAVHWMPDFGYIPKPPLTPQETLNCLNEVEVSLHMRLQLHEYEKLPEPWKDYKVDSGRVTLTVPGEFEVDLTVSDDDFESQFWFLDYRPIFTPAPAVLSEGARSFIENQVNGILQLEGLTGCYNFLHELTLTTKIGEYTRQANELSHTGRWAGTLKVERLNRALGIQYWAQSPHAQASPSWILLGVHSGKLSQKYGEPDSPSRLLLQWFREGKEPKGIDIPFDTSNISVETLLATVVSKHIEHTLSSIYNTLQSKPRYAQRDGKLVLRIAQHPGSESSLTMQLIGDKEAVLGIGTWSGAFSFKDSSPMGRDWAQRMNSVRNPADDGAAMLEHYRWLYSAHCLKKLSKSTDWVVLSQAPVPQDETKRVVYSRATTIRPPFYAVWARNARWNPQWFAMMSLSLGGDRWWLVEITPEGHGLTGFRVHTFTELPMRPSDLLSSSSPLIPKLTEHTTNIMAQIYDLQGLYQERIPHTVARLGVAGALVTHVQSADMLTTKSDSPSLPVLSNSVNSTHSLNTTSNPRTAPWAAKLIPIIYRGPAPIQPPQYQEFLAQSGSPQKQWPRQKGMVEATVSVTNRSRFQLLQPQLDRDVSYHHQQGQFVLRFHPEAVSGTIPLLRDRMQALDRLVDIVNALRTCGKHITAETITLREIVFSYSKIGPNGQSTSPDKDSKSQGWKVRLDLAAAEGVNVILETGNPHLRIIDFLRLTANTPGFKKLPAYLVFTLPLFDALEKMQDSWNPVLAKEQGACYVFHKRLDWVTIRFALSGAKNRRVHLDIKPRDKDGNLSWHVYRPNTDDNVNNENDEFNKVLKQRVWSTSGKGFKGLMNSAVANWEEGIGNLLVLVNEALQSLAGTPAPPQQIVQPQQQQQQALVQEQQQPQHQPPQPSQQPQQPQPLGHQSLQQQQQQQQPGGPAGRFHQQLQPGQQAHYQQQLHQARLQQRQQMAAQAQAQAQAQGQARAHNQGQMQGQQRGGGGTGNNKNAPVVVLD